MKAKLDITVEIEGDFQVIADRIAAIRDACEQDSTIVKFNERVVNVRAAKAPATA
jgi:hypothetical protein